MAKIKVLKDNELVGGTDNTSMYPVTSTKAVYDENNERLDSIIYKIKNTPVTNHKIANDTIEIEKLSPNLREIIKSATEVPEDLTNTITNLVNTIIPNINKEVDILSEQQISYVSPCFANCSDSHEYKLQSISLASNNIPSKRIFSITIKLADNLTLLNYSPVYMHLKDLFGNYIGVSQNAIKQIYNRGKYVTWFFDAAINNTNNFIIIELHTTNSMSDASDSNRIGIIAHVKQTNDVNESGVTTFDGVYHQGWITAIGINVVNISAIYPQIKELQKYRMAYATSELPDISTTGHKANINEIRINQNVMGISLVNSISLMVANDNAYSGELYLKIHDMSDNIVASSNNSVNLSQNLGKYVTWYFTPFQLNPDAEYRFTAWNGSNVKQVMRIHVADGKNEGVTCFDQNDYPHTDYCPALGINISAIIADDLNKSIKNVNFALGKEILINSSDINNLEEAMKGVLYDIGQIKDKIEIASSTIIELEASALGITSDTTLTEGTLIDVYSGESGGGVLSTAITLNVGQTITSSANNILALTVFAGNVTGRIKHRVLQVGEINYTANEPMSVYICYRPQGVISTEVKVRDKTQLEEQITQKADTEYVNAQVKILTTALETKIDKITGKGLSTNDYTNTEKTKLEEIESGANKTIVDASLSNTSSNPVQNKIINAALLGKANTAHSHTFSQILEKPTTLEGYGITDAEVKGASNTALTSANSYTDNKIASIINGAPETLDTLKEIADAMKQNKSVVEALNQAIGTKATKDEFTSHSTNTDIHISSEERIKWNDSYNKCHIHTNKSVLDSTTASYTSEEKIKLAGIETNANKTIVDTELSSTSTNPVQNKIVTNKLNTKVDKISGKGLSTNDYTTTDKNLVGTISNKADKTYIDTQLAMKVDKVDGKWLSTNDYTTTEKALVATIPNKADKIYVDNKFSQVDNATNLSTKDMQYMGVAFDRNGYNNGTYDTSVDVPNLSVGDTFDYTEGYDSRGNISDAITIYSGETIVTSANDATAILINYSPGIMQVLAKSKEDGICIYKCEQSSSEIYLYGYGAKYQVYKKPYVLKLNDLYKKVNEISSNYVDASTFISATNDLNTRKADKTDIASKLSTKVDKVSNKGLSTNDYTTEEKTKLAGVAIGANKTIVDTELSITSTNPVQNKVVSSKLNTKVDKVTGKGLSTNDYTTEERNLVAAIPSKVDKVSGKGLSTNDYTTAEKNLVATVQDKADKTYVDTHLATKASTTYVDDKLKTKVNLEGLKQFPNAIESQFTGGEIYEFSPMSFYTWQNGVPEYGNAYPVLKTCINTYNGDMYAFDESKATFMMFSWDVSKNKWVYQSHLYKDFSDGDEEENNRKLIDLKTPRYNFLLSTPYLSLHLGELYKHFTERLNGLEARIAALEAK